MTLMIAHRGASRAERENTLAAFVRAGEMGAEGVELDARLTSDGQLIVHHDPYVDGRAIIDLTRRALPDYVPTLAEALDACAGMFVNIEIKNDPSEPDFDPEEGAVQRVAALLNELGAGKRWLISSFRAETVAVCRQLLPEVRTSWLVERCSLSKIDAAAAAGHDGIHPSIHHLTADLVHAAHARGLVINPWTCNDAERVAELIAWGVDGIFTDVPDLALAVRRNVSGHASTE